MVARGMAAFLSVQVPAEDQLRLKPGSELYLTPKAQQVSIDSFTVKGFSIRPRRRGGGAGAAAVFARKAWGRELGTMCACPRF